MQFASKLSYPETKGENFTCVDLIGFGDKSNSGNGCGKVVKKCL
jgi:hypothetical protein